MINNLRSQCRFALAPFDLMTEANLMKHLLVVYLDDQVLDEAPTTKRSQSCGSHT
jgi:hypothetical protein